MTKMDMKWIATASLFSPATSSTRLVSRHEIESQVTTLFGAEISPYELKTRFLQSRGWHEIEQETGFFQCSHR